MNLSLVAAVSANNVIGVNNQLPWHIPEDLQNFKRITMGKPILMGRKTFDSLGRALPGRINIVITRDSSYRRSGCSIFNNLDDALKEFSDYPEIIVIGGASFYKQLLPIADTLYLTMIKREFKGDTFFPEFDRSEWIEISRQDFKQYKAPYLEYSFRVLKKNDQSGAR